MEQERFLAVMQVLEKLKCNTRHSWTSSNRQESVAEHSFRLAVMALLLTDEFPKVDMQKVMKMCLIHDFGEAVTGDVPAFLKTEADEAEEQKAIESILSMFPDAMRNEYAELYREMEELKTEEALLYKAFDKLEAVIQHNEASIDSWIPLERTDNLTYGETESSRFPYTKRLRELSREISLKKLDEEG